MHAGEVDFNGFRRAGFFQRAAAPKLPAIAQNHKINDGMIIGSVIDPGLRGEFLVQPLEVEFNFRAGKGRQP